MTALAVILIVVGFAAGLGLSLLAVWRRRASGRDFERRETRRAMLFARAREELDQLAAYVPEHWERRR